MRRFLRAAVGVVCLFGVASCAEMIDGDMSAVGGEPYGTIGVALDTATSCIEDPVGSGNYRVPNEINSVMFNFTQQGAGRNGTINWDILQLTDLCNGVAPANDTIAVNSGQWDGVMYIYDAAGIQINDTSLMEAWVEGVDNTSSYVTGILVTANQTSDVKFRGERGAGAIRGDANWTAADFDAPPIN